MTETAIFGGGCFWCTEAIFKQLKGIISVIPGYAGGTEPAEVVKIKFSPQIISYETLLKVFFALHDPTTLNRQGADTGTQYRSIILYSNTKQKEAAEKAKKNIKGAVTEIRQSDKFFPAEMYHVNYYENNINYPYCQLVISPKLTKLKNEFGKLITDSK